LGLVDLSGKGDSQKPPRVGQLPIVDFDAPAGILEVNDFDQLMIALFCLSHFSGICITPVRSAPRGAPFVSLQLQLLLPTWAFCSYLHDFSRQGR
jgi:hypothetical protein